MADDSWLDDPSLYQRKPGKAKASDDAWLDDPSLYEAKSGPWSDVTGGSWAAVGAGGQPKSYVGRVKESISREVADARNVLGSMGEVLGPSGAGTLAKVFAAGEDMTAGAYRAVADTSLARAIGVDGLYNAAADRSERQFQLDAEAARLADADAQAIQGRFRDGSLGYHAVGAAQSIPQMAGAVGVSVLGTPLAGAGFMGATTGLGQYADARADGADRGTAALSGLIHGAAEGGAEYLTLGIGKLGVKPVLDRVGAVLGDVPGLGAAKRVAASAPGRVALAAGAEVPSELATTEAQMRSDEMLGLQKYTPEEWARARRDTIIQSAGMGAGMYAITAPLGSRAEGRPAQVAPADAPFMGRVTTDPETGLPAVDLVPNDAPDVAVAPEPTADIDALLGQVPPEVLGEVAKAVAPVLDTKALADAGVVLGEPAPAQAEAAPSEASPPEPAFNEVEAWLRGLQEVVAKPQAAPVPASAAPAPATDAVPEMAPQAVESEPVAAELPITSGEQPSTEPQQRPSRFSALDMKSLVGWSTMGGRLVRAAPDESTFNDEERQGIVDTPKGEVIGRTSWVGMAGPDGQESTFWRNRPVKFTPAKANAAFDKYERGEKLSKPEQRFIDYAQQVAEQYDQAMQLLDDEKAGYEQEARMWEREELRASAGVDIDEADVSEALSLYELYREIARAGGNLDEAHPAPNEGGGEYAARLWNKLNEARNGADQRAETGDRTQGVRGRSGRNPEPVQQEQAAGFRLDQEQDGTARAAAQEVTPSPGGFALEGQQKSQAVEDDEARRAVSARQTGLFGASETRRAADEQRESRERNAPDAGGGGGLFAGRGSDPSPEARQRQAAAERSQLQGERDADELGLREAVDEVLQGADVTVRYLADDYGLDGLVHEGYADRLRSQQQKRGYVGRTAGVYIPAHWSMDGKPFVVLFTGVVRDPISAQFTVAHEVAGHHGLRTLLGNDLDNVLRLADQNPTVKAVADSMMRRRKLGADKRLLAVEEALSDINAALRTGDFHELKRRHGIDIPEGIRASLSRAIDNIVRKLRELFNKQGITFSDEQVRSLLDAAWSAAQGDSATISQLRGDGSLEQVVFRPEQIKSATGNRGNFDPNNHSILESVVDAQIRAEARRDEAASTLNVQRGAIGWNLETGQYEGVRKHLRQRRLDLQDKMKSWQDVQADIESQTGTLIEDAANVYRLENLMHGRVSTGIENIERRQVKPLLDAMKAANVSAAELEGYLYARHAKERNAQIASINPNMQDGGSGMTNAEADAALAAVDRGRLEPLARMVDAITKATRQRMLEHGLITADLHAAIESQYKHYVPLRGKEALDDGFEVDLKYAGNLGRHGVDGRGNVLRQALGRGAGNLATNILGEIIGDAQRSIILAEKARVGRAAMRLVLQHPNPNLWTLEPVQTERVLNAAGEVYERVLNDMSDPSIIAVRHKGKLYRVQVHNTDLARALNHVGVDQMGSILRAAAGINRYFSAVLTKYNPAFVGYNMTRDALFGLTALAVEHGERVAALAATNYPAAARAGWRLSRGTLGSGRMDKYAREFADAGGRTGQVTSRSVEYLARQVNNVNLTSSTAQARRALAAVGDFIGSANDAVENALRLSAYATLREEGASVEKAAEYAKNLPVNFSRKGYYGSHVGAAILFFNASVQGVHRLSKLMARPKTYAYLGTLASAQAVAAMFAMGIEDDDEEPIWNKVPDHVKRRNIVIITPDKDIITIPMPYGFNVFTYLGGQAVGYVMNARRGDTSISGTAGDLAGRTVLAAVESFSPIPLDRGVKTLVPTQAAGILYDIAMNENGFGGQIRRENPWDDRPLSVVGKPDTMEVFKLAAKGLNRIGGGDDYTKPKFGFFDRAPEDIEYLADQLAGGAGKFVVDVATLGSKSMDAGADVTAKDFPVINRFVSNIDEAAAQRSLFFERKEAVDQSKRRIRAAFGAGTPEEVAKAEAMMRDLPGMAGARFKRRKKASKSGPAGGVVTVSGSPQFEAVPGTAFAALKAADKAYDARNEVVETAYAQAKAWGPIKSAAGRERDAKIRAADAELTKSLKALTEAWNREAAAKLH